MKVYSTAAIMRHSSGDFMLCNGYVFAVSIEEAIGRYTTHILKKEKDYTIVDISAMLIEEDKSDGSI